ncbi:hypothetical protein N7510_011127 [Penicillium lagena]|uniref:uncharacterized protein n=1 Tax=Penicillium lagena TaxID=94218 RepID=UPI0025423734|nr:uncharacterized protein N7510_011127 [Penicillium lagena]KAJ5601593.1 hypothetical protein N7510_011127 [Penicillium lagena]
MGKGCSSCYPRNTAAVSVSNACRARLHRLPCADIRTWSPRHLAPAGFSLASPRRLSLRGAPETGDGLGLDRPDRPMRIGPPRFNRFNSAALFQFPSQTP